MTNTKLFVSSSFIKILLLVVLRMLENLLRDATMTYIVTDRYTKIRMKTSVEFMFAFIT